MVDAEYIRFRLVAPFGKETIRRFANNASQMKGLAARNFEDLLQVRQANALHWSWRADSPMSVHAPSTQRTSPCCTQ